MKRILCFISVAAILMMLSTGIALSESASIAYDVGFEKHMQGDLKTAIKYYSKAIDKEPSFAMAFQMRGIAEQQLKKYSQAINDYSMVITVGEPYFQAVGYYNRGIVKNMTGDYAGAIPDFTKAIELDKKMAVAFFHRGIARSKIGDLAGRMEDFRQAAQFGDINAQKLLNTYYPDWQNNPTPEVPK